MNTLLPPLLSLEAPEWRVLAQRQILRQHVLNKDFAAIEAFLKDEEANFLSSTDPVQADDYMRLAHSSSLFDAATLSPSERGAFLQEWRAAFPQSYHAHLLSGIYAFQRACRVRGEKTADQIPVKAIEGFRALRSASAAHMLEAMKLSPQPIAAAGALAELCAVFGEPDWLTAQIIPQQADSDTAEKPTASGTFYLEQAGLSAPDTQNITLPDNLPQRMQVDESKPALYWLRIALRHKPDFYHGLFSYAMYRRPRWGGEQGEVAWFANGELTKSLTEQERNGILWIAAEDELLWNDYPLPHEISAVEHAEVIFKDWLSRDVTPYRRFVILGKYANFQAYSKDDHTAAHAFHVQAMRELEAPQNYDHVDGEFRDFAHKMIYLGFKDTEGAFRKALEHQIRWAEQPTALVIAAAAFQFGLWGFSLRPETAQRLLDQAAALADDTTEDLDFSPLDACRMFWEGGQHKISLFLTRALADRKVYSAAAGMYDASRGDWGDEENIPQSLIDERFHWLDRAVEDGAPTAMFNKAWRMEHRDELDMGIPENYEKACALYEGAGNSGIIQGYMHLASLKRRYGTPQEASHAISVLKNISLSEDEQVSGKALAEIALAYKEGTGVPQSEFAAMQWAQYAEKVAPEFSGHDWLHEEIFGASGGSMAFRGVRAFFQKKPGAEHLPPAH